MARSDHILETDIVQKIIRVPVDLDHYVLIGGYHQYRELSPPYAGGDYRVARIGYPKTASEGLQRLVQVKEMLHILDTHEATSPTKEKVKQLIADLIIRDVGKTIGIPAVVDRNGLLLALCILMPRDAIDILRPAYKRGDITSDAISKLAKVPKGFVEATLTDEWVKLIDHI